MDALAAQRRFYAEEVQAVAGIASGPVVEAFARVPRERFLGSGPWHVASGAEGALGRPAYRVTPDANPAHLYHNVAVAIDAERQLNNGQPSALALWMAALAVQPGERVVHVGCGVGYYTAILAEVTGAAGRVIAFEIDPGLAETARAHLSEWPWVEVIAGDAADVPAPADGIFINAGCTHPRAEWLDALAAGGRLVIPLTASIPGMPHGAGVVVGIRRVASGHAAEVVSRVMIYDCQGARDPEENGAILQFLRAFAGSQPRSLVRAPHPTGPACLLHTSRYCLSSEPAG